MGITISQRERGTGSLKTREEEAAGINTQKQEDRKEEDPSPEMEGKSPFPSQAWRLALENMGQEKGHHTFRSS